MNRRGFFKFLGALGLLPLAAKVPVVPVVPAPIAQVVSKSFSNAGVLFTAELVNDSVLSRFGDEWVGVEYSRQLWAAIENSVLYGDKSGLTPPSVAFEWEDDQEDEDE